MKKAAIFSILLLMTVSLFGGEPTAAQYLYTAKKLIPEASEISIFMTKDQVDQYKTQLERAAAQFNFKPTIYVIDDNRSIGKNLNKISDNSVLLIYGSPILMDNSSRLFILSKCKEKNIKIMTSSRDYSQSGAFLGLITNDDRKIEHFIINLKHSEPAMAAQFTEEYITQIGATEVIR